MKTLGEKIRELRRKSGLSQEELAFEIGISRQTVSKWESDSMQPTTDNIRSLCEFFNVSAEYFIGEDKPTTTSAEAIESVATSASPITTTETDIAEVANENLDPSTETATKTPYSKKKILLLTLVISLSAMIFVASVIIGGVAISISTMPPLGAFETYSFNADVLAIVCGFLAFAALVAVITLIILIKRNKNGKM